MGRSAGSGGDCENLSGRRRLADSLIRVPLVPFVPLRPRYTIRETGPAEVVFVLGVIRRKFVDADIVGEYEVDFLENSDWPAGWAD